MRQLTVNKALNFFLCFYILLLPFEEAIAFQGITLLRIVSIIVILLSLILGKGRIKVRGLLFPLTLWMFFCLFSFTWSLSIAESWRYYQIYLIQFVMIVLLNSLPKDCICVKNILISFFISGFIATLLLFISPSSIITVEGRRAISLFNTTLDPNIVASLIVIGILCGLIIYLKSIHNFKIISLLLVGFEMLGVFNTGSRGGFLSLVLGLVSFIIILRKEVFKNFKSLLGLVAVVAVTIIVLNLIPNSLIVNRFSLNSLFGQNEIGVHSRATIWSYIPSMFKAKPIFGWGAGNFPTAISALYKYSAGHNVFFIVLVETGVIGLFLFLCFAVLLVKDVYNVAKPFIPVLFSVLFCCMFLDGLTDKFFWAIVFTCVLFMNNKNFLREESVSFNR